VDGHGRRCIVDKYGTVLMHESGPDEWTLNVVHDDTEWSVWVDLADAIKAAEREMQPEHSAPAAPTFTRTVTPSRKVRCIAMRPWCGVGGKKCIACVHRRLV
jgi:hypothetical protein